MAMRAAAKTTAETGKTPLARLITTGQWRSASPHATNQQ
ncbi:hypothetical protein XCCB100_4478 [Xanthomonas campestris pv. campestris]|uniref:Uncharacterized protein n=1 Tax=Xanthomonas campestris pv. campestris (strain B100) TaxID=509169 RepID=A0A1X7QEU2_XANCB|nr:hypothetical protein XCCB100_4478 [Xanthomonas campestris pv. campestris]